MDVAVARTKINWALLGGTLACITAMAGLGGCRAKAPEEPAKAEQAVTDPPASASPAFGTLRGVVRLAEGAELPEYDESAQHVTRGALAQKRGQPWPDSCSPPKRVDRQPVRLGEDRGLAHVLVAATDYASVLERPAQTHEVTIEDCRLTPMVVAAMRGDTLRLRNNTDHAFLPRLASDRFMQALIAGQNRDILLEQAGVLPLSCGFGVVCGRSDIIVLHHPVFTLTGAAGRFELTNVPANEPVKLNAWHPLFQYAVVEATVQAGETQEVELVLHPHDPEGLAAAAPHEDMMPTPKAPAKGDKPKGPPAKGPVVKLSIPAEGP